MMQSNLSQWTLEYKLFQIGFNAAQREYFHLFYEIVNIFTYPISLTAI